MRTRIQAAGLLLCLATAALAAPNSSPESGWAPLDRILGQAGRERAGGVHHYTWLRTDLHVTVRGVPVEPALALESSAAFQATGNGDETVAMGDLVLLGEEVNPVVAELQSNGIEILAIHGHLIDEMPRLQYVHFRARGEASTLAHALITTLGLTRTPLTTAVARTPPKPAETDAKVFETIESVLGRKGSLSGRVLQVAILHAGRVEESGMEVPPGMGMAISMNFEVVGSRAATAGEFLLVADEVNPVVRELQSHGLSVTALHSLMLRDEPRLFFLHFWAVGPPDRIAEGLKAALERVATRPERAERPAGRADPPSIPAGAV
jgi:hypothetical protein